MTELLNGCVYRFWGKIAGDSGWFKTPPKCDEKLEEVNTSLKNGDFDQKLDDLLDTAQGKLSDNGNM